MDDSGTVPRKLTDDQDDQIDRFKRWEEPLPNVDLLIPRTVKCRDGAHRTNPRVPEGWATDLAPAEFTEAAALQWLDWALDMIDAARDMLRGKPYPYRYYRDDADRIIDLLHEKGCCSTPAQWKQQVRSVMEASLRSEEDDYACTRRGLVELRQLLGGGSETKKEGVVRKKKSTQPGEARLKMVAALTTHHKYADGSVLNTDPISTRELARIAGVALGSVTNFMNREFNKGQKDGRKRYEAICDCPQLLAVALRALNGELAPYNLIPIDANQVASDDEDE